MAMIAANHTEFVASPAGRLAVIAFIAIIAPIAIRITSISG
jgi:hypothetical protein